ncbi:MAG: pyruvate ferredoxin oxidoreductase, partial [Candidatus Omnitrophota bacterium]
IKVNSYEHDEYGITTEDSKQTVLMQDKRMQKEKYLQEELEKFETVKVYGNRDASVSLLCWGSNKGVCVELAERLGIKVIQPLVLWPFPTEQFQSALSGVKKLVCVESNATGQLTRLMKMLGFNVDGQILKYDGRPFSFDELEARTRGILK